MTHTRTLADKIWSDHLVATRPDGKALLYIDRHVIHDLHGPRAFERANASGRPVRRPDLTFGVLDHSVATFAGRKEDSVPRGGPLARGMRAETERHGIKLFGLDDPRQGISHVVAPELALVLPGSTYSCPDSHACTVGALGVLAFATGTSEIVHILATQAIALQKPPQMRITLEGELPFGVSAKDVTLHVIARLGVAGAQGMLVEYAGPVVSALSIEARMTLCNMSIEMGARTSIIAPDDKTIAWVKGRELAPEGAEWDLAAASWKALYTDADAVFDQDIVIDISAVEPQITWGTDQSQVVGIGGAVPALQDIEAGKRDAFEGALAYMGLAPGTPLEGLAVDQVFIGSCTNARIEDLEIAASIVRGRHVANGVRAVVVPGSSTVKREAEARGLHTVFTDAGMEWHESGCAMCGSGNGPNAAPGKRIVSTTNRNFESRQGPGVRTHLSSPAMAAAAAVAGRIVDVRRVLEAHA
ncbi:MAG: 3-isopropylmalate dehydratase large subunit [Pseudomonadota bacterium]